MSLRKPRQRTMVVPGSTFRLSDMPINIINTPTTFHPPINSINPLKPPTANAAPTARGSFFNKTFKPIGTPEQTKKIWERNQKAKAKPPTARGFTTSKRKTKSSKKSKCSTKTKK